MAITHCFFSDGTEFKKFQRVLLAHIQYFNLNEEEAREIVKLNPYLLKHEQACYETIEKLKGEHLGWIFNKPSDSLHIWLYKQHFNL